MDKLDKAQDRALELLGEIGDGLRKAVPGKAIQWVETGAAIGVVKTGARVATKFVRRNPILATAAIAGAGLLWYAARRRARQAEAGPIEDSATRGHRRQRRTPRPAQAPHRNRRRLTAPPAAGVIRRLAAARSRSRRRRLRGPRTTAVRRPRR